MLILSFVRTIGEAKPLIEDDSKTIEESESVEETKTKPEVEHPKPRELHRTCSIFLRNLAPTVTRTEIENVRSFKSNRIF